MQRLKWIIALNIIVGTVWASEVPSLNFADSVVDLLKCQDDATLYDKFSALLTSAVTREQAVSAGRALRNVYGTIQTAQYWRTETGLKATSQGQVPIRVVWYKVTTDRLTRGNLALKIELTIEGGKESMLGYFFMQDLGKASPPPPKKTSVSAEL